MRIHVGCELGFARSSGVGEDHVFGRKLMLESCRRSSDVNFHFWLWAASSTNVRCRALRAAWTISVSSKSLMLRRIGTWKLMGARSIRNVIRTCASCSPRASTSMRVTVILNLLIPSLGLLAQTNIDPNVVTQRRPSAPAGMHVGGFSCSVLKPNARVSLVQRAVVSSLIRFLPVILMIVKEAMTREIGRMSEDYCGQHATDAND
jgi:hypothetical protein